MMLWKSRTNMVLRTMVGTVRDGAFMSLTFECTVRPSGLGVANARYPSAARMNMRSPTATTLAEAKPRTRQPSQFTPVRVRVPPSPAVSNIRPGIRDPGAAGSWRWVAPSRRVAGEGLRRPPGTFVASRLNSPPRQGGAGGGSIVRVVSVSDRT